MIIDHGRLLFDGALNDLLTRFGAKRELVVDMAEHYPALNVGRAGLVRGRWLHASLSIRPQQRHGFRIDWAHLPTKCRIQDLSVREPEIENAIRRIYQERLLKQA